MIYVPEIGIFRAHTIFLGLKMSPIEHGGLSEMVDPILPNEMNVV